MAIEAAANAIINLRDSLNDWDSKVGDGDCGSTVRSSKLSSFPIYCYGMSHSMTNLFASADVQRCNSNSGGHQKVSFCSVVWIFLFPILSYIYIKDCKVS